MRALINPKTLSYDQPLSVSLIKVADDGSVFACGIRRGGEDEGAVKFYDVAGRMSLKDGLPLGHYDEICFEPGNKSIFYFRYLDEGPRVYRHRTGADPTEDPEVFGSAYGPGKGISVDLSDDGRYLLLTVWHGSAANKGEIYYQDLEGNGTSTRPFC